MINTSNEYKRAIQGNRMMYVVCEVTFADGTEITLDSRNGDFFANGFSISDSVSGSGKFEIGNASINVATFKLYNGDDRFSNYEFENAVMQPKIGLQLQGRIEWLKKGIYTAEPGKSKDMMITVEAYDNMHKFDKDYSLVKTAYPTTTREIVRDICEFCGVPLLTSFFEGSNVVIQERPDDGSLSCRQVLSYAAQRICKFARCDLYGRLKLKWFDQTVFERGDRLDGGIFDEDSPYSSGDDADGGSFNPWNTGYKADAGTFEDQNEFHHLYSISSLDVSTDDVVITGVEVTEEFDETDGQKKDTYLYGEEGYVLSISENPFIGAGQGETVAKYLGNKLIGLRFRPMNGSFLSDPSLEAGDLAYVTDRKQNVYHCLLTNVSYTIGNHMRVSCDAEEPIRKRAKTYSELQKTIAKMRKETQTQISAYDTSVQQMNQLAANTFGYHFTVVKQDDGSIISYQHDKPTLAESKTVYKKGIDGFFVTRNYTGKDSTTVWTSGFDSSGNAALNILSVIGFYFDWAKGGTLTLGGYNNESGVLKILDAKGKQIGKWDKDGINASNGTFAGVLNGATGRFKGKLEGSTGNFSGEVHTGAGKIANWIIKEDYIQSKDGSIILHSDGRIGIGQVGLTNNNHALAVKYGLHVYAGTDGDFTDDIGQIKLFNLSPVTNGGHVVFDSDGVTLSHLAPSSLRYKSVGKMVTSEDVEPLYTLPVNWAKYKDGYLSRCDERNNTYYPMFIAEEVHNHFPLAADHKDGKPENWNHRVLIPCMMKMIQDQKKRNDKLEERISKLEKMIGGGTNGNPE